MVSLGLCTWVIGSHCTRNYLGGLMLLDEPQQTGDWTEAWFALAERKVALRAGRSDKVLGYPRFSKHNIAQCDRLFWCTE